MCKDLEGQTDSKFEHNHWEFTNYASADNNLIDQVYSSIYSSSETFGDDHLGDKELIHHLRKLTKELEFLLDLEFHRFWAYIVKFPQTLEFIDDFLQNVRKYNDLQKIQIDLDHSFNDSRVSTSDTDTQQLLRNQANRALKVVFKIIFRLS